MLHLSSGTAISSRAEPLHLAGYMFNIGMLKKVFAPHFQLHDIKQTGEFEATTRWTMIMAPTLNKTLGLQRFWDPRLIFTGVSIMGVNPENGDFTATCQHFLCQTCHPELLHTSLLFFLSPCIRVTDGLRLVCKGYSPAQRLPLSQESQVLQ